MEAHLRQLLTNLEEAGRHHDAQEPDHSRKMLNLEPETAHLLSMLVRSSRCTRLLEIGTSNGYSTIWLARATLSGSLALPGGRDQIAGDLNGWYKEFHREKDQAS